MSRCETRCRCLSLLAVTIGWMAGCNTATTPMKGPDAGPGAALTEHRKTPVTLALNWFPEAEHGGYYAALVHGEFAKEGLDVTIIPGGPNAPVIPQVATGSVPFGVDNGDKLLLGRAQEADLVAVFAPIQTSPRCILVHDESGIKTFEDLAATKDFTLAMNPGQPFAQFLTHKYPMEGVRKVPYPGNLSQFLLDKRFGQQAYSFSEPFSAKQNDAKTRNLMLADIGFNSYTSLLIVSRETIAKNPELVGKMVRASQRGWEHYLRDPMPTNAHIHKENSEMSPEILAFGVEDLRPLCATKDATPVGGMSKDRWAELIQLMTASGSLTGTPLVPEAAFTNEFLAAGP